MADQLPDQSRREHRRRVEAGAERLRAIWPDLFNDTHTRSGLDFAVLVTTAVLQGATDEEMR